MKIIIVSGAEATCKSTIVKEITARLGDGMSISKDVIKERMFDQGGHDTWDFRWYEDRAKRAFFEQIAAAVASGRACVVESNFIGPDKKRLIGLLPSGADIREVHCYARGLVSFKRAVRRNESGERHPGHHDRRWYLKIFIQSVLRTAHIYVGAHKPVAISPHVLELDTSDFARIDYDRALVFIGA